MKFAITEQFSLPLEIITAHDNYIVHNQKKMTKTRTMNTVGFRLQHTIRQT